MRRVVPSVVPILAIACFASTARAEPVTVSFSGTVASVGADVQGVVDPGDPVVGDVTFDAALAGPDASPSPNFGSYLGIIGFDVSLGSYAATLDAGPLAIFTRNDGPTDQVVFLAPLSGAPIAGHPLEQGQLSFSSTVLTRLLSDAFPTAAEVAGFLPSEGIPSFNAITFDVPGATTSDDIRWQVDSFTVETACNDGADNDLDGRVDHGASCTSFFATTDCGCASALDESERDDTGTYPCDDGIDNETGPFFDGRADFDPVTAADAPSYQAGFGDPGCASHSAATEEPACQNGVDDDQDPAGEIDFDGGASVNGGVPLAVPDGNCGLPWRGKESPGCGLGWELALLVPLLRGRRRRSPERGPTAGR